MANEGECGSTKTWNPESGIRKWKRKRKRKRNTEYGIRERRFQAVDLKKKNVSSDKNDKKKNINEQIRRVEETAGTAISRESILVKRLLIPLPAMDTNCHRRAKRGQKRH